MISVPLAIGDILDKITILHIRNTRKGLSLDQKEYLQTLRSAISHLQGWEELNLLVAELSKYNDVIWELNDTLRSSISAESISAVSLDIIKFSDLRGNVKHLINAKTGSIPEQKVYTRG